MPEEKPVFKKDPMALDMQDLMQSMFGRASQKVQKEITEGLETEAEPVTDESGASMGDLQELLRLPVGHEAQPMIPVLDDFLEAEVVSFEPEITDEDIAVTDEESFVEGLEKKYSDPAFADAPDEEDFLDKYEYSEHVVVCPKKGKSAK